MKGWPSAITPAQDDDDAIDKSYDKARKPGDLNALGAKDGLAKAAAAHKAKVAGVAAKEHARRAKMHVNKAIAFADTDMDMAKRHMKRASYHSGVACADTTDAIAPVYSDEETEIAKQFGRAPESVYERSAEIAEPGDAEIDASIEKQDKDQLVSSEVDDVVSRLKNAVDTGSLDESNKREIEGLMERLQTLVPELKAAVANAKDRLVSLEPVVEESVVEPAVAPVE
jgi:hypothetical protein